MKRSLFFALLTGAMMICFVFKTDAQVNDGQIQEWRVYDFKMGGSSARLDKLMANIILPLYKDMGVEVACFREISQNQPVVYYYLFVYPSFDSYLKANDILLKNNAFVEAMQQDNVATRQMFFRYDSYLCRPFEAWKKVTPAAGKTIFEWRKYDSANIESGTRKVQMFNKEEIAVFLDCGVNPFCFGQIIAGKDMPGLIYVTHYNDMADRDASWAKFNVNPEWQRMRAAPEWANATIPNNQVVFLTPLPYSPVK
ncbi:MAG: NIPSNAP family protein [Tannerella sp.]|jgi:hypothetical protein|nr:NIPSNAP family protein [Tannerella sp.]